jgi:hypothetical protein
MTSWRAQRSWRARVLLPQGVRCVHHYTSYAPSIAQRPPSQGFGQVQLMFGFSMSKIDLK